MMNHLELKVPPVAVMLCVVAGMWGIAWLVPRLAYYLSPEVSRGLAIFFAGVGVALALAGVWSFRQANTTVNPTTPDASSSVVTTGVYRLTRNPMYVGLLFLLVSWALYLSHTLAWLGIPAFILYMNRFQIGPEERSLSAKFGEEYTHFQQKVRRWL